jgi:hypothetical protein
MKFFVVLSALIVAAAANTCVPPVSIPTLQFKELKA